MLQLSKSCESQFNIALGDYDDEVGLGALLDSTLGPFFCLWNRFSPRLVGRGTPERPKRSSEPVL
jgi:hypothetical protein